MVVGNEKDELMTLATASRRTTLGVDRLRRMVLDGQLTGYQPGGQRGRILVLRDEIERLMRPLEPGAKK